MPVRCVECGLLSSSGTAYLCRKCLNSIALKKSFECIGCEIRVSLGSTCFRCRKDFHIDQLLAVSDYSDPTVRKAIKAFKYRFIDNMAEPLSILAKKYILWLGSEKKMNIIADSPIVIPVPLHGRRLNWRGFNHTEILAEKISNHLQLNSDPGILKRNITAKPQAEISDKQERIRNLSSGAFSITTDAVIKDKTVILVDDVCTTGATLNECARVLKGAGVAKIIAFVIAKG
jgi:competence protein ComFC